MRILYLYTEVMAYTIATIKELLKSGVEIHLVHWDKDKLSQYKVTSHKGLKIYPRSALTKKELLKLANFIDPNLIVISGWQDKDYLTVARNLRKKNKIVVCGFDDQWEGSLKQYLAMTIGFFKFFNLFFTHAWVTGNLSFEYATKLGFNKKNIISDLYSADLSCFHKKKFVKNKINKKKYPLNFLVVCRVEEIKGIKILIKAWKKFYKKNKKWSLKVIGNGSLKKEILNIKGLNAKNFTQQKYLVDEISNAGCLILPSLKEPWGVVVHEFASAGLPLILSNKVGAADHFLINGYNGYLFDAGNSNSLLDKMNMISSLSKKELIKISKNSYRISEKITPHTSANNLLSLLK